MDGNMINVEKFIKWQREQIDKDCQDILLASMSTTTGPLEDKHTPSRELEHKREWAHGSEGRGDDCSRKSKPVYTNPEVVPGTCRDWSCDNGEWLSRGLVTRVKGSKEVIDRERDRVKK